MMAAAAKVWEPKYGVVQEIMGRVYYPIMARTGTRVHLNMRGSSVTECGWRHRGQDREVARKITCEKCLAVWPAMAEEIAAKIDAR
jgi:hypothetical protein